MKLPVLKSLFTHRLFPHIFQWSSILGFGLVVGYLLFGPDEKDNPANLLIWIIWWPMLCATFLILGRAWCTICPFGKLSDVFQKLTGLYFKTPQFIKTYGLWIILVSFLELTWMEEVFGVASDPRHTAIMLMVILTGAVGMGLFFERRAYCRYMCPLGAIASVYSRISFFKIRADQDICASCQSRDCIQGTPSVPACPMFETPFAVKDSSHCMLCGNCIKNCPHDALTPLVEPFKRELFTPEPLPRAFIVTIVMLTGIITLLNGLESHRLGIEELIEASLFPKALFTLFFLITLTASWYLFSFCTRTAARITGGSIEIIGDTLALAIVPFLLFSHLGHTAMELIEDWHELVEGISHQLLNIMAPHWIVSLFDAAFLEAYFNFTLILIGVVVSSYLLCKETRHITTKNYKTGLFSLLAFSFIAGGLNLFFTF